MLHFGMNMPFYYMALYGSIMIVIVLLLRALLKERLPKFVFPVLWSVVLLRLLVPFSVSSPLSLPVPQASFLSGLFPANPFLKEAGNPVVEQVVVHSDAFVAAGMSEGASGTDASRNHSATFIEESENESENPAAEQMVAHSDAFVAEGMSEDAGGTDASGDHSTTFIEESIGVEEGSTDYRLQTQNVNVLPVVYLLGLAAVAGILGWQKYGYAKKLKGSLLMEHNETVNNTLRGLNMGHVLVFTNDEIASPLVCGLLAPRIYLPTRMDFQNTVLLHHILAHETMHIRRRDNWIKAVMLAALVLNWYNPLVWLMSKCLASDLEAACDAGVLESCDEEGRKSYAYSLLAMAITGGRSTLLYSAFSRTEVEKRVKSIVRYRKATAVTLLFSLLFLMGSTVVFASGGQAPFSSYLAPYCAGAYSRWGVRAELARDIALGKNAGDRASEAIFSVLRADTTEDPDILEQEIKKALGEEFGVEKGAFIVELNLCLSREEVEAEYEPWGLTPGKDGFWLYEGQQIRTFEDKMLGSYQSRPEGAADISVQRDRLGNMTAVTAWHEGDREYDERTGQLK